MQLSIEGVTRAFQGRRVLDELTMHVPNDAIYCLLGRNGAGKTTLLNLITQQLPTPRGVIRYDGAAYPELPPALRQRLGLVAESNAVVEELTAEQYLRLSGQLYHVPAAELAGRIPDLLAYFFEGEAVGPRRLGGFSTGMRKKISLCAAVLHTPDLLLLDEPFAGLDPLAARQTIRFVQAYRRPHRAVLLSSHDLSYVEQVATHIGVLDGGRLVFEGSAADFTAQHHAHLDEALLAVLKPATATTDSLTWL